MTNLWYSRPSAAVNGKVPTATDFAAEGLYNPLLVFLFSIPPVRDTTITTTANNNNNNNNHYSLKANKHCTLTKQT
jgi:hypothetical protein